MNRRRLLWMLAGLVAIGAIATALYIFSTRDGDFVVIGKKTHGVRLTLAMLEKKVDAADFRDCKTVQDALDSLYAKLNDVERGRPRDPNAEADWAWILRHEVALNHRAFAEAGNANLGELPIHVPAEPKTMTVKQLLRTVFRQTEVAEVRFAVRWNVVEVTTAKRADEERSRYLESVSLWDRMRDWWKEINGEVEPDPEPLHIF